MDTQINYQDRREQVLLSLTVAVLLPLLQAAVSGLLIGILSGVLIYLYGGALSVAVIIALSSSCIAWLAGLRWWRSAVTPQVQSVPVHESTVEMIEPQAVRLELMSDGKRKAEFIDLPVSAQRLRVLARGLMDGSSMAEAEWCGSDGEFTRAEFAKLRAEMLKRGLLMPNSPHSSARGFMLTRGGKAAMEYFAEY